MAGKGKIENLKPWKPGQSGNPGGRPHKRPISDRYAEIVETLLPDAIRKELGLPKGATYGEAIALAQARQAIKGKPDAAREIREAIEGKTCQRNEGPERRITTVVIDSRHRPPAPQRQIDVRPGLEKPAPVNGPPY